MFVNPSKTAKCLKKSKIYNPTILLTFFCFAGFPTTTLRSTEVQQQILFNFSKLKIMTLFCKKKNANEYDNIGGTSSLISPSCSLASSPLHFFLSLTWPPYVTSYNVVSDHGTHHHADLKLEWFGFE